MGRSTAYVALGSNLGDRDVHLEFAVLALEDAEGVELIECSPVYETDPIGSPGQGPYLNAVISLRSELAPAALLEVMRDIEERSGRSSLQREVPWGPRTLDLDLLVCGDLAIDEPGLVVPHPRLAERAFVLVPFADIAPDLVHPVLGESVETLLSRVSRDGVRPWERCLRIAR